MSDLIETSELPEILDPARPLIPAGMEPAEPSYRWVLRTRLLTSWLPFVIGALALDNFVLQTFPFQGYLSLIVGVITLTVIFLVPQRIFRRLGFHLGPKSVRMVKGWLFHTDTIVPFVRVQHIDVARGPIDKLFGTASLIVHTAGTHNSVVTLPGLSPDRAMEMRDAIRAEIKTDWQ